MSTPWVHNLNPVAFEVGGLPISWYWVFYPLGLMVVLWGSLRNRHHVGVSGANLLEMALWGWFAVLIGGRLGYALLYQPDHFVKYPQHIFQIWLGGMSFHGALLGGALAVLIFSAKKGLDPFRYGDLILVFTPLALMLGRWGNFINGELYGRPSDLPWAMIFPRAADALPRHPSQIYQALMEGLLLFTLLFLFRLKLWSIRGGATALFLILYGLFRWLVELFREPDPQLGTILWGMTLGQILCLVMMLSGIVISLKIWAPRKETY